MKTLIIDTSNGCNIAICNNGVITPMFSFNRGDINLADNIVDILRLKLLELKIDIKELSYVAFIKGPGYFSGIRIAVSLCKVLQLAFSIPCIGVCALQAYVACVENYSGCNEIISAVDIGKQGAVLQFFDMNLQKITDALYYEQEQIKLLIEDKKKYCLVGSGKNLVLNSVLGLDFNITTAEIESINLAIINKLAEADFLKSKELRDIKPFYAKEADVIIKIK
jgi:tRNA threonylcarbamoyl adenosine modification protein YeaZ